MATYDVNPGGVKKCKELIAKKRYVLDSEWGDAAPDADAENAFLDKHSWDDYSGWHLGLTEGPGDETRPATRSASATSPRCIAPP